MKKATPVANQRGRGRGGMNYGFGDLTEGMCFGDVLILLLNENCKKQQLLQLIF